MIDIKRKKDCVGCAACVQVCPKQCISFDEDKQGFRYPLVDLERCIHCNLCEKVCPVINQAESKSPIVAFAAKNQNKDIEQQSSSGGLFTALATYVIKEGGVVFGARFDENWEVVHDWTDNLEGLAAFRTSKYLQSRIGAAFIKTQDFLKEGRKVLFSGTPCQIAGLRLFLRKNYSPNLLCVDIACHGVPSPLIWRDYLGYISTQENQLLKNIRNINFRDKRNGWDNYGMSFIYQNQDSQYEWFCPMRENLFMKGFLRDLYLRPSCYSCPAKKGKSQSDITLADFWNICNTYPDLYHKGFYSLVLIQSDLGKNILFKISDVIKEQVLYDIAKKSNPALVYSANKPPKYNNFWNSYSHGISSIPSFLQSMQPSFSRLIVRNVKIIVKRMLGKRISVC